MANESGAGDIKSKPLGREMLDIQDARFEDVAVPQWGQNGTAPMVRIRTLTAEERDRYELDSYDAREKGSDVHLRARLLALAIVDESGNRVFTDRDVPALARKSAGAVEPIVKAIRRLNCLDVEQVEAAAKN
ncbi:MAG: hypothetical protein U0990_09465 [Candidatus Nanopelagicales bacterium]|nr:hypothetical protein [Candidatus Nanopelagicales bacterium]